MSLAQQIQSLGNAIVAHINAQSYSYGAVESKRSYGDFYIPLETDGLVVDVVPGTPKFAGMLTRGTSKFRVPVSVGVRKKLSQDDRDMDNGGMCKPASVDPLVALLIEIWESLLLQDFDSAKWVEQDQSGEIDTLYGIGANGVNYLRDTTQYVGVMTALFQLESPFTKALQP